MEKDYDTFEFDEMDFLYSQARAFVTTQMGGDIWNPTQDIQLSLYGAFKQAENGPCDIPKPSFFDPRGRSKWYAWNKMGDKTKQEAKISYIDILSSSFPKWREIILPEGKDIKNYKDPMESLGSAMSRVIIDEIKDEDKTVFDWVCEGNIDIILKLVNDSRFDINIIDEEDGRNLLHYACDCGYIDIARILIEKGINIDTCDEEGMTALHLAVMCGQTDIVKLLISSGASKDKLDNDGNIPKDYIDYSECEKSIQQKLIDILCTNE